MICEVPQPSRGLAPNLSAALPNSIQFISSNSDAGFISWNDASPPFSLLKIACANQDMVIFCSGWANHGHNFVLLESRFCSWVRPLMVLFSLMRSLPASISACRAASISLAHSCQSFLPNQPHRMSAVDRPIPSLVRVSCLNDAAELVLLVECR